MNFIGHYAIIRPLDNDFQKKRNLLFRIFFHNMDFKTILNQDMRQKPHTFTISNLRTLQIFPASNMRTSCLPFLLKLGAPQYLLVRGGVRRRMLHFPFPAR